MKSGILTLLMIGWLLASAPALANAYEIADQPNPAGITKREPAAPIIGGIQPAGDRVEDGGGSQVSPEAQPNSSDYSIPDSDSDSY